MEPETISAEAPVALSDRAERCVAQTYLIRRLVNRADVLETFETLATSQVDRDEREQQFDKLRGELELTWPWVSKELELAFQQWLPNRFGGTHPLKAIMSELDESLFSLRVLEQRLAHTAGLRDSVQPLDYDELAALDPSYVTRVVAPLLRRALTAIDVDPGRQDEMIADLTATARGHWYDQVREVTLESALSESLLEELLNFPAPRPLLPGTPARAGHAMIDRWARIAHGLIDTLAKDRGRSRMVGKRRETIERNVEWLYRLDVDTPPVSVRALAKEELGEEDRRAEIRHGRDRARSLMDPWWNLTAD